MKKSISPAGYEVIDGIIKDFPPDRLAEFQQRAIDVIMGIAIGMKKEMEAK